MLPDFDVDAEPRSIPMDAAIEVRDRASAGERERPRATICRANDQDMIDEADRDFEVVAR